MLYYDRIDISEGFDPTKSKVSFATIGFLIMDLNLIQDSVCNGCLDLTNLCLTINDIAIITVKNFDYRCIIHKTNKSEALNLLKNSVFENRGYI